MSNTRWQRAWDIFFQALELPQSDRDAFLDECCRNDASLRQELTELINAHEGAPGILDESSFRESQLTIDEPHTGDNINGYRLVRILGEGGMGIVFEAQQSEPIERRVALKLIKAGMDSRAVLRRFSLERQSLALMNHPGIAQVFDAGVTQQGRPYFVMEFVSGAPITTFCDEHRLSLEERIELFRSVCSAVQHAHQKGIIHRDLKPSNVLVSYVDSKPQPKIIDFGIARALRQSRDEPEGFTLISELIGTPEYMSPEQARVGSTDIDTRTDIYSLGVLLYELLTGRLPIDTQALRSGDYFELQRILREEEPLRPGLRFSRLGSEAEPIAAKRKTDANRLSKTLSGDLDWIVIKALEKDRTKRYDTVSEFSNDLERYLQKRPVTAHPPRTRYRIRKFIARHKAGVVAACATAVAMIVAIVGITMGLIVANRERKNAETVSQFLQDMLVASKPENARGRDTTYLQEVLADASKRVDKELQNQPEVSADLHFTIAMTYKSLGLFDEALPHLQSAYRLRKGHFGADDTVTLEALSELALIRWEQGDYKEAEKFARETLAGQDRILNPSDDRRLFTLNTLGLVLKSTDRFPEAEQIYREVADLRRKTLGIENIATLTSVSNLARLLEDQGKIDEAEKLMREVVAVGRRVQGEDDPHTLISLDILGVMVRKQGKLAEAEQLHRQSLSGCQRVLGNQHIDTLAVRRHLAMLLVDQGKLNEAETEFSAILEIVAKEYGEQSYYTMMTAYSLADCLLKQEKAVDAAGMYARSRKIALEILPPEHQLLSVLGAKQGDALLKSGAYSKAESLLVSSYPLLVQNKGADDPITITTRNNLIDLYTRLNQPQKAERYRKNSN